MNAGVKQGDPILFAPKRVERIGCTSGRLTKSVHDNRHKIHKVHCLDCTNTSFTIFAIAIAILQLRSRVTLDPHFYLILL